MVDDLLAWSCVSERDQDVSKQEKCTGGSTFDFVALVEIFEYLGCGSCIVSGGSCS